MARLAELVIGGSPRPWRAVGFAVDDDGRARIGQVGLHFEPGEPGLLRWAMAEEGSARIATEVDGVVTGVADPPAGPAPRHLNGAVVIDHVVMRTPDLPRTIDAVSGALGADLRRVRDAGPVQQAFFRLGEVVLEVVGPKTPDPAGGPARLWGLAVTVEELGAVHSLLGPGLVGDAKPAVQPGRSIATVRDDAGLGVPLAFLSPVR
jgi:catechol 2,3-dioxygenase-like lactoylglutathione lyase family enzyme